MWASCRVDASQWSLAALCLCSDKYPIYLFYFLIYSGKGFAEQADPASAFHTVTHIPTRDPSSTTTIFHWWWLCPCYWSKWGLSALLKGTLMEVVEFKALLVHFLQSDFRSGSTYWLWNPPVTSLSLQTCVRAAGFPFSKLLLGSGMLRGLLIFILGSITITNWQGQESHRQKTFVTDLSLSSLLWPHFSCGVCLCYILSSSILILDQPSCHESNVIITFLILLH